MTGRVTIGAGAMVLALGLGACAGGPIPSDLSAQAPGSAGPGLVQGYAALGADEWSRFDWRDSRHFRRKAGLAAAERGVMPQDPYARRIPTTAMLDVYDGHARLRRGIHLGLRETAPDAMARAQVMYDCWIEELEERHGDEAACRAAFMAAIAEAEGAPRPAPPPQPAMAEPEGFAYIIYFDYDSADLRAEARDVVLRVAERVAGMPAEPTRIIVAGHTDSAGSDSYNRRLAERRAQVVRDALVAAGVPSRLITTRSFGQTMPDIPTEDGTPEPLNRRVTIEVEP